MDGSASLAPPPHKLPLPLVVKSLKASIVVYTKTPVGSRTGANNNTPHQRPAPAVLVTEYHP